MLQPPPTLNTLTQILWPSVIWGSIQNIIFSSHTEKLYFLISFRMIDTAKYNIIYTFLVILCIFATTHFAFPAKNRKCRIIGVRAGSWLNHICCCVLEITSGYQQRFDVRYVRSYRSLYLCSYVICIYSLIYRQFVTLSYSAFNASYLVTLVLLCEYSYEHLRSYDSDRIRCDMHNSDKN